MDSNASMVSTTGLAPDADMMLLCIITLLLVWPLNADAAANMAWYDMVWYGIVCYGVVLNASKPSAAWMLVWTLMLVWPVKLVKTLLLI